MLSEDSGEVVRMVWGGCLDGFGRMSRGCWETVWTGRRGCLEGFGRLSGGFWEAVGRGLVGCLESVGRLSG